MIDLCFKALYSFIHNVAPLVPQEEMERFFSKAVKKELSKGELFVREGDICRHLLFINRGLLRYYVLHEGHDYTKDFAVDLQNPFCTAYSSFICQKPSSIWIEALEPSEVLIWQARDVMPLFERDPLWVPFAKKMADYMILRKERKELDIIKCSAEERYHRFLLDFPGLSQRVPQYHIASYLGITPESLSRIRSKSVMQKP